MNSPLVPYTGFVEIPFPHRQIIFSYFIRLHLEAENCTNIRIVKIILCHNHDVSTNVFFQANSRLQVPLQHSQHSDIRYHWDPA